MFWVFAHSFWIRATLTCPAREASACSCSCSVSARRITSAVQPHGRISTLNPTHGTASVCTGRRSEEHTSELQSQSNLVCRLLLEKKKKHRLRLQSAI